MAGIDEPHLDVDGFEGLNGPAQNVGDITQEDRIMLTGWGEELYRLEMRTCVAVYNRQRICGKMLLYYKFKTLLASAVAEIYRVCVQPHFINEDRVNDYLGYRLDSQLLETNLLRIEWEFSVKFGRKVGIVLGFGLLFGDDDYSTEEYDSDEEYDRVSTLDELFF